jgi:hypothetical protein
MKSTMCWSWWSRDSLLRDAIELKEVGTGGQLPISDFLLALVWTLVVVVCGPLARYFKIVAFLDSGDTHSDGIGACAFM